MFNIQSLHNYINKLSHRTASSETIKKLNSVEVFLNWLKNKKVINEDQYLSLKTKIDGIKTNKQDSYKDDYKALISSNINDKEKKIVLSSPLFLKFLFIILNISIVLSSFVYFKYISKNKPTLSLAKDTGRVLSYQGRLVDADGKPIINKRDITFKIYDMANGSLPLYTGGCIGQNGLVPQYNGKFNVLIGQDCNMKSIPSSLFSLPQDLYLGITIGSDKEMSPRQKIAKSSYALEADKLKGMTLGTSTASIPYIDDNGRLLIDAVSPTLKASSGMFTIEGESITLQTLSKENGSIYLFPAENTIIASGRLGIGTIHPTAKLDVAGDASISGSLFFSTPQTQIAQLNGGNITFSTSPAGEELLTSQLTIYNNGNVQVGRGKGDYKFNVSEESRGDSIVGFTNTSTEDNIDTNVLKLKLGTEKNGVLSKFIEFYAGASSQNGDLVGRIRLNKGNVAYETGAADFAEYFPISESVNSGDIISLTEKGNVKAREGESIIGVVSESAGFVGNASNNPNDKIVGLVGQIETNVSSINGEINVGESISLTKIPGVGGKALNSGEIVGKALQSLKYSNNVFTNNLCPDNLKNQKDSSGNLIICGKIKVLVQKGWYEGNKNLTDSKIEINNLGLLEPQTNSMSTNNLYPSFNSVLQVLGSNIATMALNIKNLTSDEIDSLNAHIQKLTAGEIASPIITSKTIHTDSLTTDTIKTSQDKIEISLQKDTTQNEAQNLANKFASLVIKGFDDKTVASIDAEGNASFSGRLLAESVHAIDVNVSQLTANEASISGNLYAKNITSDNISSLENSVTDLQNKINESSSSDNNFIQSELNTIKDQLTNLKNEHLANPQYYQNIDNTNILTDKVSKTLAAISPTTQSIDDLTVSSTASIFNASISNNLIVGQLLMKENSIMSLSSELNISALDKINFFNSSIIMSKDGSIITTGSLTAQAGVKTNSLQSIDNNLSIKFGLQNEKEGKVTFINGNNKEVSSINEKGKAEFTKLALKSTEKNPPSVITPAENYEKNGLYTSAIETGDTSAGVGFVPLSVEEIVIYNNDINDSSLIYLTPTSKNANTNLSVSEKKTCKASDSETQVCKPYFKVIADRQNTLDELSFNWLVIN